MITQKLLVKLFPVLNLQIRDIKMIEINNLTGHPFLHAVDKIFFSAVAKKVLLSENRKIETISLAFVDKEEIRKLNKKFRRKNKATDVLSFELKESFGMEHSAELSRSHQGKKYLGEIIICPEIVKKNAKKYKISIRDEVLKVFVHGILHLCGYDHEKSKKEAEKMEKKEEEYLSNIK